MNITYGAKVAIPSQGGSFTIERYAGDSLEEICDTVLNIHHSTPNLYYVGFWIRYPIRERLRSEVFYEPFNNNLMQIVFDTEAVTITGLTEFCNVVVKVQPENYPFLLLKGIRKETGDFSKRTFLYYQNIPMAPFYQHLDHRAINFIHGRGIIPKKQAAKVKWEKEGF